MKHNRYYKQIFGRRNPAKEFAIGFFQTITFIPRMLLEVFIRKNFGERYFSFTASMLTMAFLAWMPFCTAFLHDFFSPGGFSHDPYSNYGSHSFLEVISSNFLWYVYLAAFFYMCLQRRKEIKYSKSSFDFGKYTLYNGDIDPHFEVFRDSDDRPNNRLIETTIEPALFFGIGLFLSLCGQSIGYLILTASIFYSLSYRLAYYIGDNFILDTIDELICNEELVRFFVEGRDSRETRGFRHYGRRPADAKDRQKVADEFIEDIDYEEIK